jgi:hypothetical protein
MPGEILFSTLVSREQAQSQSGNSYPVCATIPAVCLCVRIVGIVTGTLASQERSNPEDIVEDHPHSDSEEGARRFRTVILISYRVGLH